MVYLLFCLIVSQKFSSNESGIIISRDESIIEIANKLHSEGVINHPQWFKFYLKITNNDRKIKAGYYIFKKPSSTRRVVKTLVSGKSSDIKITIPEGVNLKEICNLFYEKAGINKEEFYSLAYDTFYIHSLLGKLKIKASSLEGYLFPETYLIPYGVSAKEIIPRLVNQFFSVFPDSFYDRATKMGYPIESIVTLASLIEEEASCDSEKYIISGVYHKRLKKGMPLQCDPTVQYLMVNHKSRLSYSDLKINSPYNTYLHRGLPPGPICSPGKISIIAALWPQNNPYLYFVSKGKTHIFSKTNKEHILAKEKAKAIREKVITN